MAKTIKAIKCPSCGSVKIAELRLDYYKCKSCNTEFFLDTDDITINHKHHHASSQVTLHPNLKKWLPFAVLGILAFIILLNLISPTSAPQQPQTYTSTSNIISEKEEKPTFNWQSATLNVIENASNEAEILVLGAILDTKNRNSGHENFYYGLYDAKTLKNKFIKPFPISKLKDSTDRYEIRSHKFDDGHYYLVINSKLIYRFNKITQEIENIGEDYLTKHETLRVGIAKATFLHRNEAAGFEIVTNDGKNVIYYPLINKIYSQKQWWDALSAPVPNPVLEKAFVFTSKSSDFPDSKIELIAYTVKRQIGYPYLDNPDFEWQKDYGRAGIFTGGEPYVKRLINNYNKEKHRIADYQILTNDRTYFAAKVLAYNDNKILIGFKPTPADDEEYQIQILDVKTTSILQTFDTQVKHLRDQNLILADGYIIENNGYDYYDSTGKIIQTITKDKLVIDKF